MPVSADPLLPQLQAELTGVTLGSPDSAKGKLRPILTNSSMFGVSLEEAGLAEKVEAFYLSMLKGPGAVRRTLRENLK